MKAFKKPQRDRIIYLLLAGWALSVALAIIVHWRALRYFAIMFILSAIVFFMLSLVYGLIEDRGKPSDPK